MPPAGSCRICNHPRAEEVNSELLSPGMGRRSLRGVALLFRVSPETLRRHYHGCLGQVAAQSLAEDPQQPESTDEISFRLTHDHVAKLLKLNNQAQSCGNPVQFIVITRSLLELLANMATGSVK